MDDDPLPIACTLTPAELASRRDGLLPGLLERSTGREEAPGGFRWEFAYEPGLLAEIAAVLAAEHRCCRFLRFALAVEPGDGPVTLEVTGPAGTREFLVALVADADRGQASMSDSGARRRASGGILPP